MTTLFISDLHLDQTRPNIIEIFRRFVAEEAVNADALYILGDLFEAWIGDDAEDETGKQFIDAMRPMREARKPCFYMHGNRDFLLGERFAKASGMTLLPDPSVINLYGTPTLLMHGDTLCTDDEAYQAFRKQVRSPAWQRQFLSKSVEERKIFAAQARRESKRHTVNVANETIMDINQGALESSMKFTATRSVIHGHTHRPMTHLFAIARDHAKRTVLGDWYESSAVLRLTDDFRDEE